jgi:hypothetical protein
MFIPIDTTTPEIDDSVMFPIAYDPLACVLHWDKTNADMSFFQAFGSSKMNVWCTMLQSSASELKDYAPDNESYIEAEKLRAFYRNKLGMKSILQDGEMTKFHKKLGNFVSIDFTKETEMSTKFLGIVARLPQMYKEDIFWQGLIDNYEPANDNLDSLQSFSTPKSQDMTLQYLSKIYVHLDIQGKKQYFFTKDNKIYVIKTREDNILSSLLQNEISAGNGEITLTGKTTCCRYNGDNNFNYHMIIDIDRIERR